MTYTEFDRMLASSIKVFNDMRGEYKESGGKMSHAERAMRGKALDMLDLNIKLWRGMREAAKNMMK